MLNLLNNRKVRLGIAGVVGFFVLLFTWRSEPVQRLVQPAKYWSGKAVIQEIEVEQLRAKLTDCLTAQQRLRAARPSQLPEGGAKPAGGEPSTVQALGEMCAGLEEELRQEIKDLLEIKKKRQEARR